MPRRTPRRPTPARFLRVSSKTSFVLRPSRRADDAAESQMAGCGIDRLGHARGRAIAPAVVGRAEIGAALHHLAGDGNLRHARVAAAAALAAARVVDRAAGVVDLAVVLVPVGGPFPDIAGHVVEAVTVRRERADGRDAFVAVGAQVLPRELAL